MFLGQCVRLVDEDSKKAFDGGVRRKLHLPLPDKSFNGYSEIFQFDGQGLTSCLDEMDII